MWGCQVIRRGGSNIPDELLNGAWRPLLHDYAVSLDEILAFLILACNRINNLKYCTYFEVWNLKTWLSLSGFGWEMRGAPAYPHTPSRFPQHRPTPVCLTSPSEGMGLTSVASKGVGLGLQLRKRTCHPDREGINLWLQCACSSRVLVLNGT